MNLGVLSWGVAGLLAAINFDLALERNIEPEQCVKLKQHPVSLNDNTFRTVQL
jgi:hypothetical protein